MRDTSFAGVTLTMTENESIEFPTIEEEFEATENDNVDKLLHTSFAKLNEDPVTIDDAMMSEDKENWDIAIKDELNSMNKNKVWELVDRPQNDKSGKRPNIIDSRWVFKRKTKSNGNIKFKARLVIRGFKDRNIYDLKETYAPVSRLVLVRTVLAVVNYLDLDVCQLDVKTAFLNGTIDEEIFMEIPEGVIITDETREKVYKLKRALYGLRISPKRWNKKFTEVANSLGLISDDHDPCLFTWHSEDKIALVVLYVDDMLVASNDKDKLTEIKNELK